MENPHTTSRVPPLDIPGEVVDQDVARLVHVEVLGLAADREHDRNPRAEPLADPGALLFGDVGELVGRTCGQDYRLQTAVASGDVAEELQGAGARRKLAEELAVLLDLGPHDFVGNRAVVVAELRGEAPVEVRHDAVEIQEERAAAGE